MQTPSVYSFQNYRGFLQAFYKAKKQENPAYSFKRFSLDAGLQSANALKLVMDGDKNLSTTTVVKFAKGLALGERETEYFECLVHEEQATDEEERKYYFTRRKRLREANLQKMVRLSGRLKLFEHPLLLAVTTFLVGETIESAPTKLKSRFPLTDREISQMIESLVKKGIVNNHTGRFGINFEHGLFQQKLSDSDMKKYLREHLRMSNRAFERDYGENAKFYSHVMGIKADRLPEIIEDLKDFLAKVNEKYHSEPAEEVLEINTQAFLLSKRIIGPG